MLFSHHELKAFMPHRHPMLLVDAIVDLDRWTRIEGIKAVTSTELCYGHIRDGAKATDYAYPYSLMIESFGQTGGVMVNAKRRSKNARDDIIMLFAGVSGFHFRGRDVYPGDVLTHRVFFEKDIDDFAVLSGDIRVGDALVAEVDRIIVAYRPHDEISLRPQEGK